MASSRTVGGIASGGLLPSADEQWHLAPTLSTVVKIFGATLTPFENETFLHGACTPKRESKRQAVNAWIRDGGAFDAVIDFDKAFRDPDHPTRMLSIYDCGDHLHPSDLGYNTLGAAIDLSLFER